MAKIGQWYIGRHPKRAKSEKHSLISLGDYLLRLFIVAVFLIGLLPMPVLAAPGDGIIAGQIRSDNFTGPLVPGALVSVFTAGSQVPGWNMTTDASGNFSVSVPPGDYRINVDKPGLISVRQGQVNGVSANTTTSANMSLTRGGIIQGVVTDNLSAPLSDASVRAYLPATPNIFFASLKTGASGNYTLTAPPGAGYVVEATRSGYASANQTGITAPAVGAPPTIVDLMMVLLDTTPPAAVNNLTAINPTASSANLTWTAPGDNGMSGQAFQYAIRRAGAPITDNASFNDATVVTNSLVPKAAGSTENFLVTGLSANTTYFFALKTRDQASNLSLLSNSANITTAQGGGGGGGGPASFTIVHSENRSAFMLSAGANITQTFNITSVNGFVGTVNLTFNAPPQFQGSSLSANSVVLAANQTVPVNLTIRAGAQAPAGTSQVGLSGQSGAVQNGFSFSVTVGVAGQPLLSASPAMVAAGSQTTFSASQFPPSENVTLRWDSGPYTSQNITSGQIAGNGDWSVQVTIPGGMPGGNFDVKAITTSNASAVFRLIVTSGVGPDFMMSASPQFVSVTPGSTANVTVYVTSVNGFTSTVGLTPGSASGVTSSLSSGNVTPGSGETASAVLTITVAQWASPQMYHINVDGSSSNPSINKMVDISLDVPPLAQFGPALSLSQAYGQAGESITFTGSNFPQTTQGQTVTIKEAVSNTVLVTSPSVVTVSNGGFTGTFTIPSGIPTGNYRIKAIVVSTGDFAERDFQILAAGSTFNLGVSPQSVTVTAEQGKNSANVSVNVFSVGGNSPSVNLDVQGAPSWLTYQFGSLPANTAASGSNNVSVPAGGSVFRGLSLTAATTTPAGSYPITVRAWITNGDQQVVSLDLNVQPPASSGMAQFSLSPNFGENGRIVNFSGSGFTGVSPPQVTGLWFGQLNIFVGQNMTAIEVPQSGDSAGRFSGTLRVPGALGPGTYPVKISVGTSPNDKFITKNFTIIGATDSFVLQSSPPFLWTAQGSQAVTRIRVQGVGSTSPTVNLSIEGNPPDITANFSMTSLTPPPGGVASADLTLAANAWTPAGHYTLTVKGQLAGGAEVHRVPVELDVAPPAGFGMASIFINPTVGTPGTWVTISGSGFPANTPVTHLYIGPPVAQNDKVANLPPITTNGAGALSTVVQVPSGLPAGTYPIQLVVGTYPTDKMASTTFTLVGSQSSFSMSLSPSMLQVAPGDNVTTSVNVQSVGASSANVTLGVEGPPNIRWRFNDSAWQTPLVVTPPIGGTAVATLMVKPAPATMMGHYSLAVKAAAGTQQDMRNLEIDVGAAAGYGIPMFSLNPNSGTAGANVAFSGSNFPASTQVTRITIGGDNITLSANITTSPQGSFSGAFIVPATVGGQTIAPGSYPVSVTVGAVQAETSFNVFGSDDTFTINLSPNFLQGGPGGQPSTSGLLKALGGAAPTVKMAVKGLPPGVTTRWNGSAQPIYNASTPPGSQSNFELSLVLPAMIPMGQYPATLEGWVDNNTNDRWDPGEKIIRVNLQLSVMPPQGYGMGMLSLSPTYGRIGDTVTFAGSGFPSGAAITSFKFADYNIPSGNITVSTDGSFSGVLTVPSTAFGGNPTGPGMYPVDVVVGTPPNDRRAHFEFQVTTSNQKFSVAASPGWLARPAGDTGSVNIMVRSLVTVPPSPSVTVQIGGLPQGVTASFTTANITPPVGNMESRELRLTISGGTPMGKYPISVRGYNTANTSEEMVAGFTLEVTPSSSFMDMGMALVTLSSGTGVAGDQITVSGYGFPKSQALTSIRFGNNVVTPTSVNITTDAAGAFNALITIPSMPRGPYPVEVNVQGTIRMAPFSIMGSQDNFSLNVSPTWLAPVPAGDPAGREISITISALAGKTPTVTLSTQGLFVPFGTITENWAPTSRSVTVSNAGGSAMATLTLLPSANLPPGQYPFDIIADEGGNRRNIHLEFMVGPPANFMGGLMGMNQGNWNLQWQGTEWAQGIFFPDVILSPKSGPVGTQVSYTATNLPVGANITSINFSRQDIPLPVGGVVVDSSGGFSGSFVINQAWGFLPGMYKVEFHAEKTGWSQVVASDFNLMKTGAVFSLEATPNFIPPIPPGAFGQTMINAKALAYSSVNVTLAVGETFGGGSIPGGVQAHWGATNGPATTNVTVPSASQNSTAFYLQGNNPGRYMVTIVGWIDSDADQVLDKNIPSEFDSVFRVPLNFEIQPPPQFMNWDRSALMSSMNLAAADKYLLYFPEITLNPNVGQAATKVTISATDFPAGANVTHLRFAGMELPIPATASDNSGIFVLVFNVPRTMWGAPIGSGWYDVEIEAQKAGEPPVFIRKSFQVTAADVAFSLKAEPDFLPPIAPGGSATTLVRVTSMGAGANVTLSVDRIPPGVNTAFSDNVVVVSPGGSGSSTLTLTPVQIPPGHYSARIKGTATVGGTLKTFFTNLDFEIQPPQQFMNWDRSAMMSSMNITAADKYLLYFPEITLNPNVGQAATKVSISATAFPGSANVTHLRFAGMALPVPANTASDNTGAFTLVFNVPKTIWGGTIGSGRYDVEVGAQKAGEPPVFIRKPFQVTASDVAFTMKADPGWLPPIPPAGSTTTILLNSTGAGANVTLTVDKIPPGINTSFSSSLVNVSPGGSGSSTLTLTPVQIPPGRYGAEIKGTATVGGTLKTVYTHIEFEVQPPQQFMNRTWMQQSGVWFPEITLNPTAGPVKTKVTVEATNFPVGANITRLRFAGMELPIPSGTVSDNNGALTLVFNVPGTFGIGNYMVEVEALKAGLPPVFIAKPFFVQDAGVSFKLDVTPGFLPGVRQGASGNTTVSIEATSQAVTVVLQVDGLPSGVTASFASSNLTASPGGSASTVLTITTRASTPPGHYPLTIRGISGAETRRVSFDIGIMPPANFQMPKFNLQPDFAPAGYSGKKFKVTFSGAGFPASQNVTSLKFGSQNVTIPDNLTTDANGAFTGVFQMPTGLNAGTYDVRVAVTSGTGGYVYDSRPFSIRDDAARFILQLSPPYLPPIVQSGNGTIIINTMSVGTTTANVTLFVDGLAPGISANFTPSNLVSVDPGGSGSAILTFSVSASTPPGPYPVSIRGMSGSQVAVVPLGFGVMPNIGAGAGHATITINPPRARSGEHIGISGAGFISNATITLTAAPAGASVPINITPGVIQVQTDGTWATEITVPPVSQVPPGSYIIKATDGTRDAKNQFSIVPAENADFFLNVSPQFLKIVRGNSGNATITLSSRNGFRDAVRFSVGHLAPGVTVTFKNASDNTIGKFAGMPGGIREVTATTPMIPIPGEDMTITALVEVDSGTPIGPYDMALEAGTSTIFRSVPMSLMIVSPGASFVISPMSGPADTDIRLSGTGFTAGENVTVTFAGNAITTVPAAITVAGDGSFTALITAPSRTAGIYPVRATGATSGTTVDRPFGLMPSAVNSFVLYASPQKVDISRGGSGTVTTKIEPLGSFQSAITLSVSGLSAISGATANITPSATVTPNVGTPTMATITINVPSGATEGRYPVTVTGTSGTITQTRNITVNVVPPANTPDFALSLAPNTLPISSNATDNTTITVTSINGFAAQVNLAVTFNGTAVLPAGITATAANVTPSATTGLGKVPLTFTVAAGTQPGSWTFSVNGTSGTLVDSANVTVIVTPAGTTMTTYNSPRVDPSTITSSTPVDLTAPWGDRVRINGLISEGSEASIITPTSVNVTPSRLATLPTGASDMLGRVTNVESSSPVAGVQWDLGLPYDPAILAAANVTTANLKVAYLDPVTGRWIEVATTINSDNRVAYASPTHFSSWTLIAVPVPPSTPSPVVSGGGGGGGGGGSLQPVTLPGVTNLAGSVADTGRFTTSVTASSSDGNLVLSVPVGTIGKTVTGAALSSISVVPMTSPPAAPAQSSSIGQAYDLGPDGAVFDPPITMTFKYNESALPTGVAEKNLVVATWDVPGQKWVDVAGTVDLSANTITVKIAHFSVYTVLARTSPAAFTTSSLTITPAEATPGQDVTISIIVANTGNLSGSYEVTLKLDGTVVTTTNVTLDGRTSQTVAFTTGKTDAGTYTVTIGGLSGSFTVRTPTPTPSPTPTPVPTPTPSPTPTPVPTPTPAPTPTPVPTPTPSPTPTPVPTPTPAPIPTPVPTPVPTPTPSPAIPWPIIAVVAIVLVIGVVVWQVVARKRRTQT